MKTKSLSCCGIVLIIIALSFGAIAAGPPTINLQGELTDDAGTPVPDGTYWITFRIYDASTSGSELWSTGGDVEVSVNGGLFNYLRAMEYKLTRVGYGIPWFALILVGLPCLTGLLFVTWGFPYSFSSIALTVFFATTIGLGFHNFCL